MTKPSEGSKELDGLLDKTFAYGVDWTEYRDKSEYDHDTSMFAAKIKAQHKEALKVAIEAHVKAEIRKTLNRIYENSKYGEDRTAREVQERIDNEIKSLEER